MATSHLICVLDGLPVFFHGNFAQAIYLLPELRLPGRRKCERAEVVRPLLQLRQLFACLDAIHFLTNRGVQFANVLDGIYFAVNVAAFGLYFWHGGFLRSIPGCQGSRTHCPRCLGSNSCWYGAASAIPFAQPSTKKICHFGWNTLMGVKFAN